MAEIPWTDGKTPVGEGVTNVTGPTWQNKLATALARLVSKTVRNADGYVFDADTVSGAGIGTAASILATFSATLTSTLFSYAGSTTGAPTTDAGNGIVICDASRDVFWVHASTAVLYHGYRGHGAGAISWEKIWTPVSDGNGGQPPTAKSNRTGNTTIGWIDSVDCASGGTVTLPAGGTFETKVMTYGATYNGVKCAIVAGGAMSGTASANLVMSYKRLS
jgi:hypothetical protein